MVIIEGMAVRGVSGVVGGYRVRGASFGWRFSVSYTYTPNFLVHSVRKSYETQRQAVWASFSV